MRNENIKIVGYRGTWYVIGENTVNGEQLFLLEHETYGDETPCLIVNRNFEVILDDVYNGFSDLDDM